MASRMPRIDPCAGPGEGFGADAERPKRVTAAAGLRAALESAEIGVEALPR
jgi:hypothetical protein